MDESTPWPGPVRRDVPSSLRPPSDGSPSPLRLTTVMGVARALLASTGARTSVRVMIDEFGWDLTFQALALLRGVDGEVAFGLAWEHLLTTPVDGPPATGQ